jgi:hypothetical protein
LALIPYNLVCVSYSYDKLILKAVKTIVLFVKQDALICKTKTTYMINPGYIISNNKRGTKKVCAFTKDLK